MEVKKGYKQSQAGVIPEDWEVKKLGEVTSLMTNGFVGTVKSHYSENNNSILYIQGYNVEENSFNFHGIKKVTEEFHKKHLKSCLQEGDLLTVQTGDVGLTTIVPKELAGSNCHALIISRFKKEEASPHFFSFYLNSYDGRARLKGIETGTTMKHINVGDMVGFSVAIPTLNEQAAIATVLSDTDALIQSLEKIIAKKRAIKQGAMQKLLKPKEGWVVKKFKDKGVTELITCGIAATPEYVDESIGVAFLSSTNVKDGKINWNNFKFISKGLHRQLFKNNPPLKGDVLYSRVGTIGEAAIIDVDFEFSIYVSLTLIKVGNLINKDFLKYLLNSQKYKNLANNTVLMGGGVGNLNVNVVREFPISFPQMDEQIRIVSIFSDMDAEIAALQIKLTKYRQIKQGMMQTLLTGRIRLI